MASGKRGAGRPPFEPSDDQRRMVEAMVAFGIPHEEIARNVTEKGISLATLHKHFKRELETGTTKFTTRIGLRLAQIAAQNEDLRAASTAAIFILKARAGWSEKAHIEHSGPDGKPISFDGHLAMEPITVVIDGHEVQGLPAPPDGGGSDGDAGNRV